MCFSSTSRVSLDTRIQKKKEIYEISDHEPFSVCFSKMKFFSFRQMFKCVLNFLELLAVKPFLSTIIKNMFFNKPQMQMSPQKYLQRIIFRHGWGLLLKRISLNPIKSSHHCIPWKAQQVTDTINLKSFTTERNLILLRLKWYSC